MTIDPENSEDTSEGQDSDPRHVFLIRAHALLYLFEAGEVDLDYAIDSLRTAMLALAGCGCDRAFMRKGQEADLKKRDAAFADWRRRPPSSNGKL